MTIPGLSPDSICRPLTAAGFALAGPLHVAAGTFKRTLSSHDGGRCYVVEVYGASPSDVSKVVATAVKVDRGGDFRADAAALLATVAAACGGGEAGGWARGRCGQSAARTFGRATCELSAQGGYQLAMRVTPATRGGRLRAAVAGACRSLCGA